MSTRAASKVGRLVYVIGPSGAGKDSILRYGRDALDRLPPDTRPPVVFAHRYITRPLDAGGENHVALSLEEFTLRLDQGCFAMNWDSHGLRYGIGNEIDTWMERGLTVVVNGSRAYLPEATERYPDILPVLITVDSKALRTRLERRGRESAEEIEKRLIRASSFICEHDAIVEVDNSGPLETGGQNFVELLTKA